MVAEPRAVRLTRWGANVDWQEDDADPVPRRPASPAPPNRAMVAVVVCPVCRSWDVQRHSQVGKLSYWRCTTCLQRWKEGAEVGVGRAHIA